MFALILAVAVMLMGAGYAYWTDSVTFSNTVKTGQVELAYDTANAGSIEVGPNFNNNAVATGSVSYSEDKKIATVALNNLFPGAIGEVTLVVKNLSTIPVKIKEIKLNSISISNLSKDNFTIGAKVYYGNELIKTFDNILALEAIPTIDEVVPANTDVIVKLTYSMPKDVTTGENGSIKFNVTPTFTQFNEVNEE
ncbi:SipW-dependent-type signal peptide-containing protein [Caloramator sp. Dgby_cultured_2]|uniref:SipW-dependent-type signal peptide-containing protein n=1 Tax=Caloramator sp. Dgby_cultured_2 TaxID=3029174 RepID=UPI003158F57F